VIVCQVEKIMEQIHSHINSFDIAGLRDYWSMLEQFVFVHTDKVQSAAVRKLWTSILRIYLVNAVQAGRTDKITEFFDKLASTLNTQPEWKDWFGQYSVAHFSVQVVLLRNFFVCLSAENIY